MGYFNQLSDRSPPFYVVPVGKHHSRDLNGLGVRRSWSLPKVSSVKMEYNSQLSISPGLFRTGVQATGDLAPDQGGGSPHGGDGYKEGGDD